jgi:hypothetical protein
MHPVVTSVNGPLPDDIFRRLANVVYLTPVKMDCNVRIVTTHFPTNVKKRPHPWPPVSVDYHPKVFSSVVSNHCTRPDPCSFWYTLPLQQRPNPTTTTQTLFPLNYPPRAIQYKNTLTSKQAQVEKRSNLLPLNTLLCRGYSESIILYYIIIWHKYAYMPIYIYILYTKMRAIRLQKVDWLHLCI